MERGSNGLRPPRRLTALLTAALVAWLLPPSAGVGVRAGDDSAQVGLEKTVDSARILPALGLALSVDRNEAIPGDLLAYTAEVRNTGASLTLAGRISANNDGDILATVASYFDVVEFFSRAEKRWLPLAGFAAARADYTPRVRPSLSTGLDVSAQSVAAPGVTYPTTGDPILATTIDKDSVASWTYRLSLTLSPAQIASLADRRQVKGLRNVLHLEVTPRGTGRRGRDFDGDDDSGTTRVKFANPFRGQSLAVTEVQATISPPTGDPIIFRSDTVPALSRLVPGASARVSTAFRMPPVPAKGSAESDVAYLARLGALDASVLTGSASASGSFLMSLPGPGGADADESDEPGDQDALPTPVPIAVVTAPPATVTTVERLPVLTIRKSGPTSVDAGEIATYSLALTNTGSAAASSLTVVDRLSGGDSGSVSGVPAALPGGGSAAAQVTHPVSLDQPDGPVTDTASVSWRDANGNAYGPVSSSFTTTAVSRFSGATLTLSPASIDATKLGSKLTFTATLLSRKGAPLPDVTVAFNVSGPNARSLSAVTNSSGQAIFDYTGAKEGTDTVQAVLTAGPVRVESNRVTVKWVAAAGGLPPDPSTVAPPLDRSVATDLASASAFLFTGTNPIQTGVAPATIQPLRVSVLRGRVLTRDGQPLSGVTLSILGHSEFGQTLSRTDGMFDMAVNGGGLLTVKYEKSGFLPAQRQINAPWQDFARLPDVMLIPVDPQVTTVDLTSTTPVQVARGTKVTDADGTRQATLLVPQGTHVTMTLPGGSTQPLNTLHIRTTEYSVGPNGPKAMPAELPPTSAYTYAVELSADEAVAAGATELRFDRPLPFYLENFLGFPIGEAVPTGFYDRSLGQWVGSDNGRVIRVLRVSAGIAELDVDGSGNPASAAVLADLGISDAERRQLAGTYAAGTSLWRVPIAHFSPIDLNWPLGPPPRARAPEQPQPHRPQPEDKNCLLTGSIIECQSQVLGEQKAIVGTPFRLHYTSDQVLGRLAARTLQIPLSGASVPPSLKRIDLQISVAGQLVTRSFAAAPNQTTTFTWDGKDAYGRPVNGRLPVVGRTGYVYTMVYRSPAAQRQPVFALTGTAGFTGVQTRGEVTLWQNWQTEVSARDTRPLGLGGWTLSVHHAYDPGGRVLELGDGGRRSIVGADLGAVITTVAGTGRCCSSGDGGPATRAGLTQPEGLAVAPDGSVYIADSFGKGVRRVGPDGIISTVAGGGFSRDEGVLATQAELQHPVSVALGPDGSLFIVDQGCCFGVVRRVGADGRIRTVTRLFNPSGLAIAPDGSLYIVDTFGSQVRRVGPDGTIATVAGTFKGFSGDGGLATQAELSDPTDVAVGPDGSLYLSDGSNERIRRVTPDGIISTVAGTGGRGFSGDGGPATQATLSLPKSIAVAPDGTLFISDSGNARIRRVRADGIIRTVAGNGSFDFTGDRGPASQAAIGNLFGVGAVAVGPDGSLFLADADHHVVRKVGPALPGQSLSDFFVASEDGREVYVFNATGRHLRTLDALTGGLRHQFTYDGAGRLSAATDGDGNRTTIQRDATGHPTAIVAPGGQRTSVAVDANGFLSRIANPAGEAVQLTSTVDGLLTRLTDAKGNVSRFSYDAQGRLARDEDPAGGVKTLTRTETANGFTVTLTTGLNRSTTYTVERLPTGSRRERRTDPNGTRTETLVSPDGTETVIFSDGTRQTLQRGPDPRFGMQAPLLTSLTSVTPGGRTLALTRERRVTLTRVSDPFSVRTLSDVVTINGHTYTSSFDASTGKTTMSSPAGRQTSTVVDPKGRVVAAQRGNISPARFGYDSHGRLSTMTFGAGPDAPSYTASYDTMGQIASVADPLLRATAFSFDGAGRLIGQALADGRQNTYTYDPDGNLASFTPSGRPAHSQSYTATNLLSGYSPPTLPGAGSTTYDYNTDHQLVLLTRPSGDTVRLEYDSAGRPTVVTLAAGRMEFAYDPASGHVTQLVAAGGESLLTSYDGFLPVTSSWRGAVVGRIDKEFDNNLRVMSMSVNGTNPVRFEYDNDGLMVRAGQLQISRSLDSGILTSTSLGGLTIEYRYDSAGDPIGVTARSSAGPILGEQYTRDPLGRITQRTETIAGQSHTQSYVYDRTGRLTDITMDGTGIAHFDFDSNGNRIARRSPVTTVDATYDLQDRLHRFGSATYAYSPIGDLMRKDESGRTTAYAYDELGNLLSVKLPDGRTVGYVIDGQNRRVGKRMNGALVQGFFYDGPQVIAELDSGGSVISRFVYATKPNVPDYMVRNGIAYLIVSDDVGSPRLVVDSSSGRIAQRIDYDESGNVLTDSNPGFQPFGFAGGVYDRDTGLTRLGARDYHATTGRWTRKDTRLPRQGDLNLYEYAADDPINFVDFTGQAPMWAKKLSNFVAGFGDTLSFGLSALVRDAIADWLDLGDTIYRCQQGWYTAGEVTGALYGLALGELGRGAPVGDFPALKPPVADPIADFPVTKLPGPGFDELSRLPRPALPGRPPLPALPPSPTWSPAQPALPEVASLGMTPADLARRALW